MAGERGGSSARIVTSECCRSCCSHRERFRSSRGRRRHPNCVGRCAPCARSRSPVRHHRRGPPAARILSAGITPRRHPTAASIEHSGRSRSLRLARSDTSGTFLSCDRAVRRRAISCVRRSRSPRSVQARLFRPLGRRVRSGWWCGSSAAASGVPQGAIRLIRSSHCLSGHDCCVCTRALERARNDLAAGRLWKALDRITGAVAACPSDQAVLELAGEVFFEMGDLPRAGAYWFLTEKDGPEVESALNALKQRHGAGALGLIAALPVRAGIDAFPPKVRERLSQLQQEAKRSHRYNWNPQPRRKGESTRQPKSSSAVVGTMARLVLVTATVGVWSIGLTAIIYVVVPWLVDRF